MNVVSVTSMNLKRRHLGNLSNFRALFKLCKIVLVKGQRIVPLPGILYGTSQMDKKRRTCIGLQIQSSACFTICLLVERDSILTFERFVQKHPSNYFEKVLNPSVKKYVCEYLP